MPTYLWQASYTSEGTKGVLKEGGTKRKAQVEQLTKQAGGKLLAFYYAFGDADVIGISEYPDTASALALSLTVNASGAVQLKTTLLISPEEVDAATKKQITYRAPGT